MAFNGYGALALIAGLGIPVMAALNAGLGARLGSAPAASVILFLVAGLASLGVLIVSGAQISSPLNAAPPVYYLAGLFVTFYIVSITWVAPRFGIGNAVFFILLGQLIAASLVDHFGLFGAPKVPLDRLRALGLVVMMAGVFLARKAA